MTLCVCTCMSVCSHCLLMCLLNEGFKQLTFEAPGDSVGIHVVVGSNHSKHKSFLGPNDM